MNRRWQRRLGLLLCALVYGGTSSTAYGADADSFKTDEYFASKGLEIINAASAYSRGYTGQGILFGVCDDYTYLLHPEFGSKLNSGTTLPVPGDYKWLQLTHGTHVGGIMAAAKNDSGMHGVAFEADLLSGTYFPDFVNQQLTITSTYTAFNNNSNIKIINNSWSQASYIDEIGKGPAGVLQEIRLSAAELEKSIIKYDKVIVFAVANEGQPTPRGESLLPYLIPRTAPNFISVMAVDPARYNLETKTAASGFMTIVSNAAKYAEENSIAAPGQNIYSAIPGSSPYLAETGSSMAAPFVSGVAGLVHQAFPYMNGRQIVDTVLTSASSFTPPKFTVTMQSSVGQPLKLNVYYFGTKPAASEIASDLAAYFDANRDAVRYFSSDPANPSKLPTFNTADQFVAATRNVYGNVPSEVIFGQGLLDAGAAVRGPGLLNARRMDSSNLSAASQYGQKQALYRIDTQGYDHSEWSNDIGEKRAELLKDHGENKEFGDLTAIYKYYLQSDAILSAEKKVTYTQGQEYITDYNLRVTANGLQNLPVGLIKSGQGTLALNGTNSYTGSTVAAGGALEINGSVAGDAWSVDSGTIAGVGTITGSLYNQSAVRPGREVKFDSNDTPVSDEEPGTWKVMPGTLTVNGNMSGKGKIAMAATSQSNHGKLSITGSASVDGTTFIPVAKSTYQTGTYSDVVKASNITGTLSSQYAPFTLLLSARGTVRDGKSVDLELVQASNFTSVRQQRTYDRLASMYSGQSSLTDFHTLPAAQANEVLTSIYGGAQLNQAAAIQRDTSVGQAVTARLSSVNENINGTFALQLPSFAPGVYTVNAVIPLDLDAANSWWAKTSKSWASTGAGDGLPGLDSRGFGFILGRDKKAGEHWRTGALIGYNQHTGASGLSSTTSQGYRLGMYGGYSKGAFGLETHLNYGMQSNQATRYLQDLTLQSRQTDSRYNSTTLSFGLTARYNLHHGREKLWQVSPYAAFSLTRYHQDAYSEKGAGELSQIADQFASTYSTGEVGLAMARTIHKGRYAIHVGYKRVLSGSNPDMTIAYSGAPGSKLTIRGSQQDTESLVLGLNLQGEVGKNWTIDGQLTSEAGRTGSSLTASLTLKKVW